MSLSLTPSQRRALDLSSHLSVTANAGAGKTSVLARRFVEIVLGTDARISEIVAITFTEQAAGELRRRVHDVLLERERGGGLPVAGRRRLADARNQLSSAIIGTIHSFCSRILRMYPAEAEVDASFTVVEGQDRARLIAESIAESFSAMMGEGGGDAAFRDLLRAVPPAKLERFLLRLFSRREEMYRYFRREGGRGADGAARLEEIAGAIVDRAASSGWAAHARSVARAASGKEAKAFLALIGHDEALTDRATLEGLLIGADETLFTKQARWRAAFLGKTRPEDLPRESAASLERFERRYARILRSARLPGAAEREAGSLALSATLARVFADAQRRYGSRKEEVGALDFEDLQIKTVELLARPDVRERLRSEYRYLLVDEFQDTNDLQYAILRGLAPEIPEIEGIEETAEIREAGGAGEPRNRGGANLFIVGDPKQSIYGFRNADVGVFYDARKAIAAMNSAPGGPEDHGTVVLAESFRPLPEIAAFVNALFSRVMVGGPSRYEVAYEEIVAGRPDRSPGSVELLLTPAAGKGERAGAVRAESAFLAHRLREVAAGGRGYGSCAVLLRDRTNLPALERAFEEAGVPYLLAGGVGFFQTQEVYDFLNYLRFLVSPADDAALAGVLRSPFHALSDADLLSIAMLPGDSFYARLRRAAGSAGPAAHAFALLESHRQLADRVPVTRLLRKVAADTGWLAVAAGLSHGPQRRENFLKLLDLARSRSASGAGSLYDFATELDRRARDEEREGQAATSAAGTAVRVMTVHAAKGLEFPVVVLPFLDRPHRRDSEPIVEPGFGIAFNEGGDGAVTPLAGFLKALSDEKRIAEEKRIFYVACTRAQDVLILSGNEGGRAGSPTPLGWLLGAAAAAGAEEKDGRLDFGVVSVPRLASAGESPQEAVIGVRFSVPVRRAAGGAGGGNAATERRTSPGEAGQAQQAGRAGSPGPEKQARRVLAAPMAPSPGGETYTATMLKTWLECPARYYLAYVLGISPLPGDDDDRGRNAGESEDSLRFRDDAALEGELTHVVLAGLQGRESEEEAASRVKAAIAAIAAGRPAAAHAIDLAPRVTANVIAFLHSSSGRELLSRPGARVEFQVSARVGDAVVTGKIDRLDQGPHHPQVPEATGGGIALLDYKTDAVDAGGAGKRAEAHRFQLELYAYLASRLFGRATVRATLVFLKAGPAEVTFDLAAADFERVERSVRSAIDGIRSGSFPAARVPCDGCPGAGGPCPVRPAPP